MTKELDITYNFMIGNLYVQKESINGVELTSHAENAYTIENENVYCNSAMIHIHIDRVVSFLEKMRNRHGIYDIKIIEIRKVAEIVEREVELVNVGDKLVLKPNVEDIRIDIEPHKIGTAIVDNSGFGWAKVNTNE